MIELIIDSREKELQKELNRNNFFEFKVVQLDLGDIIFKEGEETILIIERKTVKDLKASICDGRSREQKMRLISTTERDRIIYLIEGNLNLSLDTSIDGIPVSTLLGSIINTQLRDNIKVYKTFSIEETSNFIIKLLEKIKKDGLEYFNYSNNSLINEQNYAISLKKQKKANMTPKVWFMVILLQIPQVNDKIAQVIVDKYISLFQLVKCYNDETDEILREKLLQDLTFVTNTGKNRRIGNIISKRIYNFLIGGNEDKNQEEKE